MVICGELIKSVLARGTGTTFRSFSCFQHYCFRRSMPKWRTLCSYEDKKMANKTFYTKSVWRRCAITRPPSAMQVVARMLLSHLDMPAHLSHVLLTPVGVFSPSYTVSVFFLLQHLFWMWRLGGFSGIRCCVKLMRCQEETRAPLLF